MRRHINISQYVHTFICIEIFMIRFENIHKVVRIDNIRFASDHGMNHICKSVIESETLGLCLVDSERIPSDEYNLQSPGGWNLNSR